MTDKEDISEDGKSMEQRLYDIMNLVAKELNNDTTQLNSYLLYTHISKEDGEDLHVMGANTYSLPELIGRIEALKAELLQKEKEIRNRRKEDRKKLSNNDSKDLIKEESEDALSFLRNFMDDSSGNKH